MAQLRNTGNTVRFQSSKQLRKPTVHKTGVSGFNFRREINIFLKYFPQFRLFISYNSFLQLLLYHFYMNFCQGLFHAGFFNTGLFIFLYFLYYIECGLRVFLQISRSLIPWHLCTLIMQVPVMVKSSVAEPGLLGRIRFESPAPTQMKKKSAAAQ